jgi:hypothetical protein
VQEWAVAGGWVGYIYAILGCGICTLVALGSTAFLYVFHRYRGRDAKVSVRALEPVRSQDSARSPDAPADTEP